MSLRLSRPLICAVQPRHTPARHAPLTTVVRATSRGVFLPLVHYNLTSCSRRRATGWKHSAADSVFFESRLVGLAQFKWAVPTTLVNAVRSSWVGHLKLSSSKPDTAAAEYLLVAWSNAPLPRSDTCIVDNIVQGLCELLCHRRHVLGDLMERRCEGLAIAFCNLPGCVICAIHTEALSSLLSLKS